MIKYSRIVEILKITKKMRYKNFVIKPLIRKDIFLAKTKTKKKQLIFSILIIGGSQGAKKFDNLFKTDLTKLSKNFKIRLFHQTSNQNLKDLKNFYFENNISSQVFTYTNHLHKIINKCDFVITRSGASTINELVFLENLSWLYLSLLLRMTTNIIMQNIMQKKKLGWLIREKKIKQNFLYKFIRNLIKNKKLLSQKRKNMRKFHARYDWHENSNKLKTLI